MKKYPEGSQEVFSHDDERSATYGLTRIEDGQSAIETLYSANMTRPSKSPTTNYIKEIEYSIKQLRGIVLKLDGNHIDIETFDLVEIAAIKFAVQTAILVSANTLKSLNNEQATEEH